MTLKLTSAELTQEKLEEMEGDNNVVDRLFPEVPIFTVCLAVAYPHDADDTEGDPDEFPILEAIRLHVPAFSASRAMEKAIISTTATLDDDDVEHYTISIVAVFEGALTDLVDTYNPTQEFIEDAELDIVA